MDNSALLNKGDNDSDSELLTNTMGHGMFLKFSLPYQTLNV